VIRAPNAIREGYLWVYGAAPKGARYQAIRAFLPIDGRQIGGIKN